MLRSSARQQILCCSRQAGKSTVSATVTLHQAIYVPNSLVLLLAPVGRQSKELLVKVRDESYQAVLPMLAVSQDRVILLSTPNGKRGFFHHEWTAGGPEWERTRITAPECPGRFPPASSTRSTCVLGELEDAVFHHEDIHAAISDDVKPLFARREVA